MLRLPRLRLRIAFALEASNSFLFLSRSRSFCCPLICEVLSEFQAPRTEAQPRYSLRNFFQISSLRCPPKRRLCPCSSRPAHLALLYAPVFLLHNSQLIYHRRSCYRRFSHSLTLPLSFFRVSALNPTSTASPRTGHPPTPFPLSSSPLPSSSSFGPVLRCSLRSPSAIGPLC